MKITFTQFEFGTKSILVVYWSQLYYLKSVCPTFYKFKEQPRYLTWSEKNKNRKCSISTMF